MNAIVKENLDSAHKQSVAGFARRSSDISPQRAGIDMAIVGTACRFPGGVDSLESFWTLLTSGRDPIGPIPATRWNHSDYFDATPESTGKTYAREGGFIEDVIHFDPAFFDISPREAAEMDPQQRLLLELSWEVFCNAGVDLVTMKGSSTGVFVGMSTDDYAGLTVHNGNHDFIDAYNSLGTARSVAAGRIAYTWGFHGPVIQMDTACSSSLTALHQACQSIASGDCEQALVAGINLILTPEMHIACSRLRALSPTSRCKVFDDSADGYVRSEGAGCVLIKPLSTALSNGDRILGVVKSCAINHDGKSNGLTAPNGKAQVQLIRKALNRANIHPSQIGYVEMHGTGTRLGDPIEVHALCDALDRKGRKSQENSPLLLGSVKSNIGHTEAAAGMASLFKALLIQQKGQIPANLHFSKPNQQIRWSHLDAVVVDKAMPWPQNAKAPLIGISAFGLSGTNVHLVVAPAPEVIPAARIKATVARNTYVLPVSARDDKALLNQLQQCLSKLEGMDIGSFSSWCDAHALHSTHFNRRKAFVATSPETMKSQIELSLANGNAISAERADQICFVFTGQGAQFAGMGRELAEQVPAFRKHMQDLAPHFDALLGIKLEDLWWGAHSAALNQTQYTQPALFAFEYCLARTLIEWNIKPDVCLGHSVGEYVAACISGMLSLEDALNCIVLRARCMANCDAGGVMVAVMASPTRVQEAIQHCERANADTIAIAGYNSPTSTVISGEGAVVLTIMQTMVDAGIRCIQLDVSHAFHSPLMKPATNDFLAQLPSLTVSEPLVPVISNVTAQLHDASTLTPAYLAHHITEPVRFTDCIRYAVDLGANLFIEIGPKSTLSQLLKQIVPDPLINAVPAIAQPAQSTQSLLRCIAQTYSLGVNPLFSALLGEQGLQHIERIKYPLAPQRLWTQSTPKVRSLDIDSLSMLYKTVWEERSAMSGSSFENSRWLMLDWGQQHLETWCEDGMRTNGADVIRVVLDKFNPATWYSSVSEYLEKHQFHGVLVTTQGDSVLDQHHYDECLQRIVLCKQLLAHLQHLSSTRDKNGVATSATRLWVITAPQQEQSSLLIGAINGFLKGASLELRQAWGGVVELADWENSSQQQFCLAINSTDGDFIRIEKGHTLQQVLAPATNNLTLPLQFSENDAVLIAGGTGGIGFNLIQWCVERGLRRVLVVGRRPLKKIGDAEKALESLKKAGVTICYQALDIACESALHEVVSEFENHVGPLTGFIHAAGIASLKSVEALDEKEIDNTIASKLWGAWNLHQLSLSRNTKLFLMCSSVSSVWGGLNLAHYSAANACLDALATVRLQASLPVHCIQWGPWAEAGMAKDQVTHDMARLGVRGFDNKTARSVFFRVVDSSSAIVTAADADWQQVERAFAMSPRKNVFKALVASESASVSLAPAEKHQSPLAGLNGEALREQLQVQITRVLTQQLHISIDGLPFDAPLSDLGVDSLMAVDIGKSLEKLAGQTLPATLLFDAPNAQALVENLYTRLNKKSTDIKPVFQIPIVGKTNESVFAIIRKIRALDESALDLLLSA